MRLFILFILLSTPCLLKAQNSFMFWTETGVDGEITKKLDWSFELNMRYGDRGLNTFFPQPAIEYKPVKWLKVSGEYRYILDKQKNGNYDPSHRFNLNATAKKSLSRFKLSCRLRYQLGFISLTPHEYNSEFDKAIRLKPQISYDIDNFFLSPEISTEFFYNPSYGPLSPGLSKVRYAAGFEFELKKPHSASIKIQLDKKINDYKSGIRTALVVGYTYSF